MDSSDSSERSNLSSITKYDDALINLANARCGYKNSIVKYMARINELELAKLKKITYKEIDPSFPEIAVRKFEPQSNQITKHYQTSALVEENIMIQSKNLKNEINDLKKITRKLKQEKEYTARFII